MVSKTFPAYHPRAGEPTLFREKILSGDKIHTIRDNYEWWRKRVEAVNAGKAIISLRQWTGSPYNFANDDSTQEEFMILEKAGIQSADMARFFDREELAIMIGGKAYSQSDVAKHDGLTPTDMYNWFQKNINFGAVIHFTDFRY